MCITFLFLSTFLYSFVVVVFVALAGFSSSLSDSQSAFHYSQHIQTTRHSLVCMLGAFVRARVLREQNMEKLLCIYVKYFSSQCCVVQFVFVKVAAKGRETDMEIYRAETRR